MSTLKILILFLLVSFSMVSFPAIAAEPTSGVCEKCDRQMRAADMRIMLATFTALAEEQIMGIQRSLRILSLTQEAASGDWNVMKDLLAGFNTSGIHPAAVWYARTDGRYYTVEKGLQEQDISDRPYFSRLMAGEDVAGDLVISRSTGMRAAVIAVPIRKGGKVTGGLGVSLSADEVSRKLQEVMALPKEMVIYALDAKGQTSLHRVSSLLFAFPSDMGSRTLKEAVQEMLSRQEGVVRYDFHGEKTVFYKRSPVTGWVFAIGVAEAASAGAAAAGDTMPLILSELEKEVTLKLQHTDAGLAKAAKKLSETGLQGPGARKILLDLCRSTPYAIDCAAVHRSGRMITIEPGEYHKFEGSDISKQEQVIRLRETKRPVFSKVFRTVEGFDAVDIEHPVFAAEGEFMGAVSILIRPESLISGVATPLVRGLPVDIWAMQKDGRIIYDPDEEEVGRMLFDDPIYTPFPSLLSLGMTISKERSGSGRYEYLGTGLKKPVQKEAYWTTAVLHETEWRLVVTHTLAEDGSHARRDLSELGIKSFEESLRDLAGDTGLKEALSGNNKEKIQGIFRKFYADHNGIYAIQWVDQLGINRYGCPEENSPVNFDFHSLKTPSSPYILKALAEKKESSFETPLAEGKEGLFFMVPVHKGDAYLGMVYMIRLKP